MGESLMSTWIITGIIAIPFLVLAVFLLNGKGAFLIAGFNTMSDEKKAAYDKKALCKAVGVLLIVLSVLMMLFPLAIELNAMWLFWVIFALFMVITIGFAIYANTGNRFRKDPAAIDPDKNGESQPVTRGKKTVIIISVIVTAVILIAVCVMFYFGERDPAVTVHDDGIHISAMYGLTVEKSDIAEITLINKSMIEIGIGIRTNGYGGIGNALKGNFNSPEHGNHLLFVYASTSPTIHITRKHGSDIFISFRSSEMTGEIYRKISAATQ